MERTAVFSGWSVEAGEEESGREWRRLRWPDVAGRGTEKDRTIIKLVTVNVTA